MFTLNYWNELTPLSIAGTLNSKSARSKAEIEGEAVKFYKNPQKLCLECGDHRALFRFRGRVKRDFKHTLCFRCFHSLNDSCRARSLTGL